MNQLIVFAAKCVRLLRGEVSTERLKGMGLVVGQRFGREGGVRIDTSYAHLISIGDDVTLAPNVHILAHDASLKQFLGISRIGRVTIGNRVFIGANSVVLPDVVIGDDVVIGAGSVVTKNVPSGTVYGGNPARRICDLADLVAKHSSAYRHSPVFDGSYSSMRLAPAKQKEMKTALEGTAGYQKCENFARVGKLVDRA